jgi:hypothetical protein
VDATVAGEPYVSSSASVSCGSLGVFRQRFVEMREVGDGLWGGRY